MWWFESQPIGRIMNRFSKDIEAIDQRLMPQVFQLVAGTGSLLSITVILGYSVPPILGMSFLVKTFVIQINAKHLYDRILVPFVRSVLRRPALLSQVCII